MVSCIIFFALYNHDYIAQKKVFYNREVYFIFVELGVCMILSKSKKIKAFICALVCTFIVLSPSLSAPQRVEASAGAIAIVATVGVIAIGLTYLYGTGLTSRIVEKCKQSDFAQFVVNIGNKAIQYGTGVGLYSVAQRTVNDLIKKGVSSTTISATSNPAQAMSLLTSNNVAVKPTSSEIKAIVNSIPANTYVENPSYSPRSKFFESFNIDEYGSYFNSIPFINSDYAAYKDLLLRLSDYAPVYPFSSAMPYPCITVATRYQSGRDPGNTVNSYFIWPNSVARISDSNDFSVLYPSMFVNGLALKGRVYYPCHINVQTGICDVFQGASLRNVTLNFSNGSHTLYFRQYGTDYNLTTISSSAYPYFRFGNFSSFNINSTGMNGMDINTIFRTFFNSAGCYLVDLSDFELADSIHVNGSDITSISYTDVYTDTPTLNINKVTTGFAQPDVDIKFNADDIGDNVYLPIVVDVAVDGFSVPDASVVDDVPVTVPDEVIDNIDASVDDYVAENPIDTNVVVDVAGIVTSIDYVTQAIGDSNYHKGFQVPNFNIDVPEYDSNFLSRWGKWIEFTRGVFNGLSSTELGGIVITSALIMVAVAVFRKVL